VFTGKALIACKTAVQNFTSILETEGGPEEKRRGRLVATLNVKCAFLQVWSISLNIFIINPMIKLMV